MPIPPRSWGSRLAPATYEREKGSRSKGLRKVFKKCDRFHAVQPWERQWKASQYRLPEQQSAEKYNKNVIPKNIYRNA